MGAGLRQLGRLVGDFRPGELRLALGLQLQFAAIVFALLLARTARDALYLSRSGINDLPWMYVGVGVVTTVATLLYTRLVAGGRLARYAAAVQWGFGLSFVALTLALGRGHVVFAVLYLWVEVLTAVTVLQFWSLTNQRFHPRQARRLYGFIAAGQAVGNLACGVVASWVGRWLTTADLLWIVTAVSVLVGVSYTGAGNAAAGERTQPAPVGRQATRLSAHRRRYVAAILLAVAYTFLATSWVDFQFKVIAGRSFDEAALARFFGQFYATVGLAGFVVQVFLFQHMTRILGVFRGLALMPLAFMALGLGLVAAPSLAIATALKFSENGLRYSIFEPFLQFLYLPLASDDRVRAQALASGTVKPLAMGAAGVALVLLRPGQVGGVAVSWLGLPVALVAGIVLLLLVVVRRGYLQTLAIDLRGALPARRRPRWRPDTAPAIERVLDVVAGGPVGAVDWIVERVHVADAAAEQRMWRAVTLRADLDPGLRVRAWRCLQPDLRPHPRKDDVLLQAAAAAEPAAAWIDLAQHVDPQQIRLAEVVISELVALGDVRSLAQARDTLVLWAAGAEPPERMMAVRLARRLSPAERQDVVARGLCDTSVTVRRAALAEVARAPEATWLDAVLAALDDPWVRGAAVQAVAAYGERGYTALQAIAEGAPWLKLQRTWPMYVRAAVKVDWRLHLDTLFAAAADPIYWRAPALALPAAPPGNDALVRRAVAAAEAWSALAASLPEPTTAALRLLQRAAVDRIEAACTAAAALSFAAAPPPIAHWQRLLAVGFWRDVRRRANLAEILDQTVAIGVKARLLQILDGNSVPVMLQPQMWQLLPGVLAQLAVRYLSGEQAHGKEHGVEDVIERVLFLSSVPLFADLAGEDLEQIAAAMVVEKVAAGTTLMRRGDPGDSLYLITSGTMRVHVDDRELAVLQAGAVVGEMALLDDQPRSADVSAVDDVRVLRLDRLDFELLLDAYPAMARAVMRVLTARLRQASDKLRG